MNLLLIERQPASDGFSEQVRSAAGLRPGSQTQITSQPESQSWKEFLFRLQNLSWATGPGPNAIVVPVRSSEDQALAIEAAKLSARDQCQLIVLCRSGVEADAVEKIDDAATEYNDKAMIVYGCQLDKALAQMLPRIVDHAMFGRYMVAAGKGPGQWVSPIKRQTRRQFV